MLTEEARAFTTRHLGGWHHIASGDVKERIVVVHGLGEHSGRHLNTIGRFVEHGFECLRFDLRGHGISEGKRQWIEAFDDYLDDVQTILDWIESNLEPRPTFFFGHSLGGAICLRFIARREVVLQGLMLSAPAHLPGSGVSAFRVALARGLNTVLPRLTLPGNLDKSAISRDPVEIEKALQDPLNCRFNTIRQGYEILKALPELRYDIEKINTPVLFVHGKADRLVRWEGSEALFERCPSADKTRVYFDDGYHELHNDIDREQFWQVLLDWLDRKRGETP